MSRSPVAPAGLAGPPTDDLPDGFRVRLSRRTRVRDAGTCLVGGTAGRVVFLAPAAAARLAEPGGLVVTDQTSRRLARLLVDRGLADPWWPEPVELTGGRAGAGASRADRAVDDVTVVVPVLERPASLRRLLAALPHGVPVVVVDDGSRDPAAIAEAAAAYDARVVRHATNQGPSAARNTGLREVRTSLVAFVDSDVRPEPGWLATLRRHLDDPATALAAPRVHGAVEAETGTWLERYEQARSSLDLGGDPAAVRALGVVAYVPSACLLARVSALGEGFCESMRSGEDVDLVWRLLGAGWRVRYEPSARVRHEHRTTLRAWLARKAFYGASAAPLAERHRDAVAPMVLTPWSTVVVLALLAQRRWSVPVALASWAAATAGLARRLERSGRPLRTAALLTGEGAWAVQLQTASSLTRHHWPLAVAAAALSHRARRALLLSAVLDAAVDHRRRRPHLDPVRFATARRLDDLAYGAGLWQGAWRCRSVRALLPQWRA